MAVELRKLLWSSIIYPVTKVVFDLRAKREVVEKKFQKWSGGPLQFVTWFAHCIVAKHWTLFNCTQCRCTITWHFVIFEGKQGFTGYNSLLFWGQTVKLWESGIPSSALPSGLSESGVQFIAIGWHSLWTGHTEPQDIHFHISQNDIMISKPKINSDWNLSRVLLCSMYKALAKQGKEWCSKTNLM